MDYFCSKHHNRNSGKEAVRSLAVHQINKGGKNRKYDVEIIPHRECAPNVLDGSYVLVVQGNEAIALLAATRNALDTMKLSNKPYTTRPAQNSVFCSDSLTFTRIQALHVATTPEGILSVTGATLVDRRTRIERKVTVKDIYFLTGQRQIRFIVYQPSYSLSQHICDIVFGYQKQAYYEEMNSKIYRPTITSLGRHVLNSLQSCVTRSLGSIVQVKTDQGPLVPSRLLRKGKSTEKRKDSESIRDATHYCNSMQILTFPVNHQTRSTINFGELFNNMPAENTCHTCKVEQEQGYVPQTFRRTFAKNFYLEASTTFYPFNSFNVSLLNNEGIPRVHSKYVKSSAKQGDTERDLAQDQSCRNVQRRLGFDDSISYEERLAIVCIIGLGLGSAVALRKKRATLHEMLPLRVVNRSVKAIWRKITHSFRLKGPF